MPLSAQNSAIEDVCCCARTPRCAETMLNGGKEMRISYNKLWKLLIDRDMTRTDLKDAAGISATSIAKLGKGANITTDVLLRICETLNVHIEDILETRDD